MRKFGLVPGTVYYRRYSRSVAAVKEFDTCNTPIFRNSTVLAVSVNIGTAADSRYV